jgi:hypothetical protein
MAEGEQGMILRRTPHAREDSVMSTGELGLSVAIRPNLRMHTTRSIASFEGSPHITIRSISSCVSRTLVRS